MNNLQQMPQAEFRQCFKCNYEAVTDQTNCPKCGKKTFFTSGSIRKRGVVAMVMGLIIASLMGGVAIFVGTMMLGQMKNPETAKKITDDQFVFLAIFGLFGLLIALGLHFVVTGGWMAAFGKRNRVLIWLMWVFLFLVLVVGGVVSALVS